MVVNGLADRAVATFTADALATGVAGATNVPPVMVRTATGATTATVTMMLILGELIPSVTTYISVPATAGTASATVRVYPPTFVGSTDGAIEADEKPPTELFDRLGVTAPAGATPMLPSGFR
jgi:hypothetical protein